MKRQSHINTLPRKALVAMMELEAYTKTTEVCPVHKHLIKIRASQINGCNYCLAMHTAEAKVHGETDQRINELPRWKESRLFNQEERIILALTEYVTLISNGEDGAGLFIHASRMFPKAYLVEVLVIITTINAWNRVVKSYDCLVENLAEAELSN